MTISLILIIILLSCIATLAFVKINRFIVLLMCTSVLVNILTLMDYTTKETYQKALTNNPYEMVILYDIEKQPVDTIYKLKKDE